MDGTRIRWRRSKGCLRAGNTNGRKRMLSTRRSTMVKINIHGMNADVTPLALEL